MQTRVSSKGQVVIPGKIRRKLGVQPGAAIWFHGYAGADSFGEAEEIVRRRLCFIAGDHDVSHLPAWVKTAKQTTDGHLAVLARPTMRSSQRWTNEFRGAFLIRFDRRVPQEVTKQESPAKHESITRHFRPQSNRADSSPVTPEYD